MFADHMGRPPAVCGRRPGVLPHCLHDTGQPSADRLVQIQLPRPKRAQDGPGASSPETKAKPETAEPCDQLSPLIPETATAASWRLAVGGWYRVLDSRQLCDCEDSQAPGNRRPPVGRWGTGSGCAGRHGHPPSDAGEVVFPARLMQPPVTDPRLWFRAHCPAPGLGT